MAYGLSNDHVTDDVTWSQRCCEAVRSAILVTAWNLVNSVGAGGYGTWRLSVVIETSANGSSISSRRHHKSAVQYDGVGLTACRYSDTCFILPTSTVKHLSQLEAHPVADTEPRYRPIGYLIPACG